jgi:CubicO group peptidase (beta-lactamase class C family)
MSAGSAIRIFNFCNRQPTPCKCFGNCPTNPPPIPNTKVEDYLINNNIASGAPFSYCYYGNAITGVDTFAGEGNGRNNTPVNPNMYFRFASMTKILGMIVLGAAMEDGYIASLDDSVSKYIDEFNGTGTYIDPTSIVAGGGFDSYGSPIYNMTTIDFSLNIITIRHLVTMTAGFGYSFLGTGSLMSLINQFPDPSNDPLLQNTCNRNTFIAWLQYIENNPGLGKADTIDSFYDSSANITFTESIINRIQNIPFLFKPGTQYLYDISPTIMGAVVGAALQKQNKQITSVQYLQSRILSPLGITNMWFSCGSSQPPSNAQTNMTDAYFVRNDTFIGTTTPDASGNPYRNDSGKGTDVSFNTLYRCFDLSANGDGFTNQAKNAFLQNVLQNQVVNDNLAGGYDWSGCGTLIDFAKILKMIIKKGKNQQNQQILKSQTVEWILVPKVPENQALWLFGNGTYNFSYDSSTWCGAFNKFMPNQPSLPFPCGPNTYAKQSYFGMHYFFDTETGNYMISGTETFGSSWYIQQPDINTYPYGIYHSPGYEPDELILWKLTTTE